MIIHDEIGNQSIIGLCTTIQEAILLVQMIN